MTLPQAGGGGVFSGYKELSHHGNFVLGTVCWHGHVWFVKSLCGALSLSSEARLLLLKEYEILLSFNHPGIVRVVGFQEIDGVGPAMLMEYVDGVHLDSYISHAPRRKRAAVARKLLEAMAYVHSKGVAHLDLKPENILISGAADNPRVTVIDFNLSDAARYSRGKTVGGNRAYSAPEQWEAGYVASPRADVWSLGKLLAEIRPGISWRGVERRAVRPEPEERFADASEMLARQRRTILGFRRIAAIAAVTAVVCSAAVIIPELTAPAPGPITVTHTDTVWREREYPPDSAVAVTTIPAEATVPLPEIPAAPESRQPDSEEKWSRLHDKGVQKVVTVYESRIKSLESLLHDDSLSFEESLARFQDLINEPINPSEIILKYLKNCPAEIMEKHTNWGTGMEREVQAAASRYLSAYKAVSSKLTKMQSENTNQERRSQ